MTHVQHRGIAKLIPESFLFAFTLMFYFVIRSHIVVIFLVNGGSHVSNSCVSLNVNIPWPFQSVLMFILCTY